MLICGYIGLFCGNVGLFSGCIGLFVMRRLLIPHEKLLGITWASNPATRKDLAARTWGVFWY